MEYYASLRTSGAIEAAEVAVRAARRLRADHRAGPAGDRRGRRGRPRAGPRVQQVGPRRRGPPPRDEARDRARPGPRRRGSPRVNVSARTGRAVQTARRRRCAPRWRTGTAASRPASSTSGWPTSSPPRRRPCAAGKAAARSCSRRRRRTRPPTFVLFTSGFLEAGYRRFLERKLRETSADRHPGRDQRAGAGEAQAVLTAGAGHRPSGCGSVSRRSPRSPRRARPAG